MSESTLDKVRRLKAKTPQNKGSFGRMKGIYHNWLDGENVIRLVGEFLEVRTHFIAPAPKRNDRGLCRADVFKGEGSLPMVVNCPDWDAVKEEAKPVKTCPLCKLSAVAKAIKKEVGSTAEEKKFFDALGQQAEAKFNLKWNILDRNDPNILLVDEQGNEKKVLGFKIANVGKEAWNDIESIFAQCKIDISDPNKGVDIKVVKGHNGKRTVYSAQAILEGTSLRVTPFTEEEKALQMHNLKERCGQSTPVQKIIDALHEDLRQLYEENTDTAAVEDPSVGAEPVVADEKSALQDALADEPAAETPAEEVVAEEAAGDDDALCGIPTPAPVTTRPAAPRAAVPVAAAPKTATVPIRRAVAVPTVDAQKKRV